ncbi:MAG: hypothetical protein J6P28_08750 [Treponema sp.]|nr:hypothetical protein [Treponema sp.]
MIVFKILLTIIRIPFTVWYVLTGWLWLVLAAGGAYGAKCDTTCLNVICAFLAFEFASLTKFYNIRYANLSSVTATILKIAFIAGGLSVIVGGIYACVSK